MFVSLLLLVLVAAAVFVWLASPVERVQYTKTVGWIKETLVLGFWINTGNLSDGLNRLKHKEQSHVKGLAKVRKQIEDEEKHLKSRVEAINEGYRSHLQRWNGKRYWKYLLRKVPIPSIQFVKELESEAKPKPKTRESWYSLQDLPAHLKPKHGSGIATITFQARPEQKQNQRKKGGNNQNQQNNPQVIVVDHHDK